MRYPNGDGLDGVNLEVRNGEFVYLVGPTGAGKSSVLKLIYMDEFPDQGYVLVDEYSSQDIRDKEIPHLRRKRSSGSGTRSSRPSRTATSRSRCATTARP